MKPIKPHDANLILSAPKGMEASVEPLHCVLTHTEDGSTYITSLWEPDELERTALLAGLPVMVSVMGRQVPPMMLTVGPEIDQVYRKGT